MLQQVSLPHIIKKLSISGIEKLKEKILFNIKKGIKLQGVLGTHLALCKYLKINEANEEVLKIIKNKKYTEFYLGDVVDIYLDLREDIDEIVQLIYELSSYNEYWYFHLIKLITPNYSDEAIKSLIKALQHPETKEDVKLGIAIRLADLGEVKGFQFLTELIRINKKSPYSI